MKNRTGLIATKIGNSSYFNENGKVIITGCLGKDKKTIKKFEDKVLSISGPSEINKVLRTVQKVFPQQKKPIRNFLSPTGIKLTPKHYSYLKISEGCNHTCKFCIIPNLRGKLKSNNVEKIMNEAKLLVENGTKELLIISQDTSAFGIDLKLTKNKDKTNLVTRVADDETFVSDSWTSICLFIFHTVARILSSPSCLFARARQKKGKDEERKRPDDSKTNLGFGFHRLVSFPSFPFLLLSARARRKSDVEDEDEKIVNQTVKIKYL